MLPSWGIALGLVLFLGYMCRRTVSKAVTMFSKEKQQRARAPPAQVYPCIGQCLRSSPHTALSPQDADAPRPPLGYPWSKIGRLAFLWLAFLSLKVLESRTTRCTWPYAGAMAAQVVVCVGCGLLFAGQVHREHASHGDASQPLLEGGSDLHFDSRVVMHAALGTCAAGVIAGLLGLGGGAWRGCVV